MKNSIGFYVIISLNGTEFSLLYTFQIHFPLLCHNKRPNQVIHINRINCKIFYGVKFMYFFRKLDTGYVKSIILIWMIETKIKMNKTYVGRRA